MGRRIGSRAGRPSVAKGLAAARLWLPFAVATLALAALAHGTASARQATLADRVASKVAPPRGEAPDRMLVNAVEMVYDSDHKTVEARGDVQLYYRGRELQADRVRYDRANDRVFAEGRVKLTERDGTVAYADRMELTNDFRDGFVDSLRIDGPDATQFTAARAERTDGDVTVLENGTYAACTPCVADPTHPPTWQVRAKRVIHNNEEREIYFEDAELEFLGVPIAYVPYFATPDPSVTRKSGLLAPGYAYNSRLGVGLSASAFWAIAPNMDLTVSPTFYTQQGLFLQSEWRHQLLNGSYNVRMSGIFQNDPAAFSQPPFGPGNRTFRGALDTKGQFFINEAWRFGWNVDLVTDKWFVKDYRMPAGLSSYNFFQETTSTVFLAGQGEHGFFDLRGYYFQGLSRYDLQEQQPLVAPVADWNKIIDLDPAKTAGIGGRIEIDANVTHVSRQLAAFQSTGLRTLDSLYNLYDVCKIYTPGNCLVRGIGGDYTRATLNASWKRQYIDPLGEVWTPFVFAHLNGEYAAFNQGRSQTYGASVISNASQAAFFGPNFDQNVGSATPGAGVEYRYPLVLSTDWATHVFEPIAQLIVRPNAPASQSLINEDAQSLVFDDSNLFEWNKYSGYDRFEGGTRANYGAQYTMTFNNGAYANLMAGQSFQVAGLNSYAAPDAANIGLQSGLNNRKSNIVTRFSFATASNFALVAKGQFDPNTLRIRRVDASATARFGALEASLQYARYHSQPLIGYDVRREGLSGSLKYQLENGLFATGSAIFDMSRHLYAPSPLIAGSSTLFFPAGFGLGVGYKDADTTVSLSYTSIYQDDGTGNPVRNQTIMLDLKLRTLGDAKVSTSLGDIGVQDGLSGLNQ
jgi:LPS-assembly protein